MFCIESAYSETAFKFEYIYAVTEIRMPGADYSNLDLMVHGGSAFRLNNIENFHFRVFNFETKQFMLVEWDFIKNNRGYFIHLANSYLVMPEILFPLLFCVKPASLLNCFSVFCAIFQGNNRIVCSPDNSVVYLEDLVKIHLTSVTEFNKLVLKMRLMYYKPMSTDEYWNWMARELGLQE